MRFWDFEERKFQKLEKNGDFKGGPLGWIFIFGIAFEGG